MGDTWKEHKEPYWLIKSEEWNDMVADQLNRILKVAGATSGNLVSLDPDGGVVDSGKSPNDFDPSGAASSEVLSHEANYDHTKLHDHPNKAELDKVVNEGDYCKVDGSRPFSDPISGVTPTQTTHLATKGYVDGLVQGLDWQNSVLDKDLTTPPTSPLVGDRYIVGIGGSGDWLGHDSSIAEWSGIEWIFIPPNEGFAVWVEDEDNAYNWNGIEWILFGGVRDHGNLTGLLDDDHPQYLTNSRHDDKPVNSHNDLSSTGVEIDAAVERSALIQRNVSKIVAASNSGADDKSIADYICDGVSDQEEINNAIIAANGGRVYLAKGDYYINSPININVERTSLEGNQPTLLMVDNIGLNIIEISADYVQIKNLVIDGNKSNNGANIGIRISAKYTYIEQATIQNCIQEGIYLDSGTSYAKLVRIKLTGNNWGTRSHISGDYTIIDSCLFDGASGVGLVNLWPVYGAIIRNCIFNASSGYGMLHLQGGDGHIVEGCKFIGSIPRLWLECSKSQIANNYFGGSARIYCVHADNIIAANSFKTTGWDESSITIGSGAKRTVIANNSFWQSHRESMLIQSNENTIVGNKIYNGNSSPFPDGTYDDIKLDNSNHNIITNNIIINDTVNNRTKYGIEESGSSDYNIIKNNQVYGQAVAPILKIGANSIEKDNIT